MNLNRMIASAVILFVIVALALGLVASLAVLAVRASAKQANAVALPAKYDLLDPSRFTTVMIEIPRSTTSEEDERVIEGIVKQIHASGKDAYVIVCGTPNQTLFQEQLQCVAFLYFRRGEHTSPLNAPGGRGRDSLQGLQ